MDVWLHPRGYALIGQPFQIRQNPQVDAQFSAQWTVAFALLHGAPTQSQTLIRKAVRAATDVRTLAERVRIHRLPDADSGTHERLTLRLQDGRQATISHADIKGEPGLPLSRAERLGKFLACAAYAHYPLDPTTAEAVFTEIEHLRGKRRHPSAHRTIYNASQWCALAVCHERRVSAPVLAHVSEVVR